MYMIAVQGVGGGGGEPFMLLSNVLDTNGEGVGGGIPLPRWGLFGNLGTKNQVFMGA